MKHFRAAVFALCLQAVTGLYPSINHIMRQQSLEVAAEVASKQPRGLARDPAMDISLLSVVRKLQRQLPTGMVAAEVKSQQFENFGQTLHERQLLTDMGHLEDQLESWKAAEYKLQAKMVSQQSTIDKLKAQQAKALRDQQEAAAVRCGCEIFMCLLMIFGFALCMYVAKMQVSWQVKRLPAAEESTLPRTDAAAPRTSAPEPLPVARQSQPGPPEPPPCVSEFPKGTIQAMASLPHHTAAEEVDFKALDAHQQATDVWKTELGPPYRHDVPSQLARQPIESSKPGCEFFSLAEEPNVAPQNHTTAAEEDWWLN